MTGIDPLTTDPREDKLPKYAQDIIAGLRRKVSAERTAAEAARLDTNPTGVDTVLIDRTTDDFSREEIGLGNGALIRFKFPDRGVIEATVKSDANGAWLQLNGRTSLIIRPQVTNAIAVVDGAHR